MGGRRWQILWLYVHLPIKGGTCHHNLSFVGRHRVIAQERGRWEELLRFISAPPMVFTHLHVKKTFSHLASREVKSRVVLASGPTLEKGWVSPPEHRGRPGSWSPSLMLTSMAFFPG